MRLTLVMAGLAAATTATAAPDAARLRARAALALAVADTPPVGDNYPEQYNRAVREAMPLLVWVGQPARCVPGCVCHEAGTFPGVSGAAVVVGLPAGGQTLRRVDLPGRPTDTAIRAALATPTVAAGPLVLRARTAGP